jgi:hypothetical protein
MFFLKIMNFLRKSLFCEKVSISYNEAFGWKKKIEKLFLIYEKHFFLKINFKKMAANKNSITFLNNLSTSISFYFSCIVVPLLILLNILAICVFLRKKMRQKTNMSIYYISLAVMDTLAVSQSILYMQLFPIIGINLAAMSHAACKSIMFYRRAMVQAPSWFQLAITLDRFRLVVAPNKFKWMTKKKWILILLGSTFLTLLFINVGGLFFEYSEKIIYTTVNKTNTTQVIKYCLPGSADVALATDLIQVFFRSYIPFGLMLILNIILTRKFIRSKQKLNRESSMKRENNFTFTVIAMNLTFFVL